MASALAFALGLSVQGLWEAGSRPSSASTSQVAVAVGDSQRTSLVMYSSQREDSQWVGHPIEVVQDYQGSCVVALVQCLERRFGACPWQL